MYLFITFTVAQMSASMTPGGITLTKPKSCRRTTRHRAQKSQNKKKNYKKINCLDRQSEHYYNARCRQDMMY